jgi:hypothetical protein
VVAAAAASPTPKAAECATVAHAQVPGRSEAPRALTERLAYAPSVSTALLPSALPPALASARVSAQVSAQALARSSALSSALASVLASALASASHPQPCPPDTK